MKSLTLWADYFRDGVSEGQYFHVLSQEVRDIKDALKEAFPTKISDLEKVSHPV